MSTRPAIARRRGILVVGLITASGLAAAAMLPVPTTFNDFHLAGTQVLDVGTDAIWTSSQCLYCHGPDDPGDPHSTWAGSKMAHAGRNPLFFAQMTLANQDVENAGYFCMRCHVPMSFVTGAAYDPSGGSIGLTDMDGVSCHFCHAMVDPIYVDGKSPPEDAGILGGLDHVPGHYGNSMFVLDPTGTRRGARGSAAFHDTIYSPFHQSGTMCGTCHDVGNVQVTLRKDGTYFYNALDTPAPDENLHTQFPLERTFSEWQLSAFAQGGVDMAGRFGGDGHPTGIMHSCQDCHMPRTAGMASPFGEWRPDLATHEFAGSSVWALQIIAIHGADDPGVDQVAIARGIEHARSMLERAASLELAQEGRSLRVRIINETGHKLPTGHIEGRRVWANVRFLDSSGAILREYGHYDFEEAELDEPSTRIYEMHVGLSVEAAEALGLPPGPTTRMALANTIEKDTRIPPRGFSNAAFAAAGAPVVGHTYADGQYWDDQHFEIPDGAHSASVTVNYQMMPRHYVEVLRDNNHTDDWGDILYDLWLATDKAPPIAMVSADLALIPPRLGDLNGDGHVDSADLLLLFQAWGPCPPTPPCAADLDGNGLVGLVDLLLLLSLWG